ncbi:MAG: PadR family transcriptional regulator [Solirubrobacteraceae bacterium]
MFTPIRDPRPLTSSGWRPRSPTGRFPTSADLPGPRHAASDTSAPAGLGSAAGIIQRATTLSGGTIRLSTGTLYALLERAIGEELIVAGEPYVRGGRQRRDYTLTPAGRTVLSEEAQRLEHAARLVVRRLRATARTAVAR